MPFTGNWNDQGARQRYLEQSNMGISSQIGGLNLYDPAVLEQLRTILAPYFSQQNQNLERNQGSALNQASRGAGAYAAAHGIEGAGLQSRARSDVFSQFAPQFGQLQENQLGSLLNAGTSSQQFRAGNLMNQAGLNMGLLQNYFNQSQQENEPSGWERAFGGLIRGGAQVGGAALLASDRRLKKNIERVGGLPNGLNVYEFNYLWSDDKNVGVMADEVRQIIPSAVVNIGGYDFVNYAMLGG
jgi:hypothetical protein